MCKNTKFSKESAHCLAEINKYVSFYENTSTQMKSSRNNIADNYTTSLLLCVIFTNFVNYI